MRIVRAVLILVSISVFAQQSQPPSPVPAVKSYPPKQTSTDRQTQTTNDQRGTEQSPIVVKVLPSTKAQDETSNGKTNEFDQSSPDWWMVRLSVGILLVYVIQTIVFGIQARRLKETIGKMGEIAGEQSKDIQASIAEASRSAKAMEDIAKSMTANVESVRVSVSISREIADRQKLISELQSRAYLTLTFESMLSQNIPNRIRFQPTMRIQNVGNTPAYDIRFSMIADVCPFPLRDDFSFPLPEEMRGFSSVIGPGLHKVISAVVPKLYNEIEGPQISIGNGQRIITWGVVKYRDAFDIERFVNFGFTFYYRGNDIWMCQDTNRHNDSN